MATIVYGKTEGPYFSFRRVGILAALAMEIHGLDPRINEFEVWYNERTDFHCLEFTFGGRRVLVQLYRVLACYLDGCCVWSGCPPHNVRYFARHIVSNFEE